MTIPTPPTSGNGVALPTNSSSSGGNSNSSTPNNNSTTTSKAVAAQMQKMRDANTKYKNLLKMAKERIEQQEVELKRLRGGLLVGLY